MQIDPQLNQMYTFDSFIEGDCNRVARRAGKTVAEKPGANSFNPLVIYGGVGLGKTHLAQAIGNDVKRMHPGKVVLYVSSEKCINQFQDHSRNNAINDFIHFYQLIDVLIIDDVQFFSRAEKSQDAFFAIFNHLNQSGGLGSNGHLGFNEPPSSKDARTRIVDLTPESIVGNARYWGGEEQVPKQALTCGMDLLLAARRTLLVVSGAHKHHILHRTVEGPPSPEVPASNVNVIADRAAWHGLEGQ